MEGATENWPQGAAVGISRISADAAAALPGRLSDSLLVSGMTFRTLLASHEETQFAADINSRIGRIGAAAHVFEQVDTANNERRYGIVFSAGPERLTLWSQSPWHIEKLESVISEVRLWLEAANGVDIWTTEPPDDIRRELERQE
jgi:hypothetical protein